MKTLDRREVLFGLSTLAALGGFPGKSDAQQTERPAAKAQEPILSQSRAIPWEQMPAKTLPNGAVTRAVLDGVLPTGEYVSLREITLPAGQMFAAHKHIDSGFLMITAGTLELNTNGKLEQAGPGGVIMTGSNVMHGIKNVGDGPANYFVMAIHRESGILPV